MKKDWNFSHRWDLVVAGEAWNPPVCCTLERGEGKLEFQPSVESGICRSCLNPARVLYTGTPWFSVHDERCGMEAETGA